jgi:hypothetical protein
MSHKTLIILVLVLVPVALIVVIGWFAGQFPNAHFVIAYAIGATLTVLLAVGLFALTFYSSRSGHDEQIGNEQDSDEP